MSDEISGARRAMPAGIAAFALTLALVLCGAGCAVQMVAAYDEQTDKAVSALQRKMETLFVDLESQAGTPQADYDNYAAFYKEVRVDISAIHTRAQARPDNKLTVEQIGRLRDSLAKLEEIHRIGITDAAVIAPLRAQFESAFVSVLKFEMAKRRRFEKVQVSE